MSSQNSEQHTFQQQQRSSSNISILTTDITN